MADSDPRASASQEFEASDFSGDVTKDTGATLAAPLCSPAKVDDAREQPSDNQASDGPNHDLETRDFGDEDAFCLDTDDDFDDRRPKALSASSGGASPGHRHSFAHCRPPHSSPDASEQAFEIQAEDGLDDGPETQDADDYAPHTEDEFDDRPPRSTSASNGKVGPGQSATAGVVWVWILVPVSHDLYASKHAQGNVLQGHEVGSIMAPTVLSLPSLPSLGALPFLPLAGGREPQGTPAGHACTFTRVDQQDKDAMDPKIEEQSTGYHAGVHDKYASKPQPSASPACQRQPSPPIAHSSGAVGLFCDMAGATSAAGSPSGAWAGGPSGSLATGAPPLVGGGQERNSRQPAPRPPAQEYGGQWTATMRGDGREQVNGQWKFAQEELAEDSRHSLEASYSGGPGGLPAAIAQPRAPGPQIELYPNRVASGPARRPMVHHKSGQPVTTLTILNVPVEVSAKDVMSLIDRSGFAKRYNYFYAPSDFKSGAHNGQAFVNFISSQHAEDFFMKWNAAKLVWGGRSRTLRLNASNEQGFEANASSWTRARLRRVKNPSLRPFIAGAARR